jgi:alginate O-acetyltransferase complex protein AlgI
MKNISFAFGADIPFLDVIMPIGISFYTFQALSYVVDVYRGDVSVQKRIDKLALYICLFPQLIAGPIIKYHDVKDQIDHREERFDKVVYGVKRFVVGLAKKMLIANTMGAIADKIFVLPVDEFSTGMAWVGAIAYTFQIFYDFSGYSDMAIGLGSIFGFKFLENFNYPYISKSITEFWRRWHISLSTWFKEYLYIPLGGNRVAKSRMYLNLFIVFLATGIWHGAEWTFIVWGLWHGFFIIMEKWTGWHKKEGGIALSITQHLYTMLVFIFGWVLFRADNISYAWQYFKNMLGLVPNHNISYTLGYYIDNIEIIAFVVAVLCSMPIFKNITLPVANKFKHIAINTWIMCLFILSASAIAASTYNPFIYFRF